MRQARSSSPRVGRAINPAGAEGWAKRDAGNRAASKTLDVSQVSPAKNRCYWFKSNAWRPTGDVSKGREARVQGSPRQGPESAIAVIPLQARNRLHRPKHAFHRSTNGPPRRGSSPVRCSCGNSRNRQGKRAYSVARERRSLVRLQAARITCAWEGRRAEDPDLLSPRQFYIAGRIRDRLTEELGRDSVFMDVDSTPRGVDFTEYIADHIRNSDIVIAAIGQNWLAGRSWVAHPGRRRREARRVWAYWGWHLC
jgi:hypothetical protein